MLPQSNSLEGYSWNLGLRTNKHIALALKMSISPFDEDM